MRRIDHIAYAVPDLKKGSRLLKETLGCEVIAGGKHLNNGTHNSLINLGNEIYLELIAKDDSNTDIASPRWMAVDTILKPTITRWAIKSIDLAEDLNKLKQYDSALANSFEGSRKKQDGSILNWHMALPLPHPEVEIAPFAVNWKDSVHPTKTMPQECELLSIEFVHNEPASLTPLFEDLGINLKISKGNKPQIKLKIKSPNGIVELT